MNEYKSVQVTRILNDFYDSDPKRGHYGGGGLDARIGPQPTTWAIRTASEGPSWGSAFKARLKEFPRSMQVHCHGTSLAVESNNITLDPEVKDAWGLPAMRVTYKDHPDDLANARFLQDRGAEILEAAGALRVTKAPVTEQTSSAHLLGTCRMGNDPATSVIDKYHRSHDVPNLFVCDGSSLVTSGRGQPTMTIQALAFRAGEHIAPIREARRDLACDRESPKETFRLTRTGNGERYEELSYGQEEDDHRRPSHSLHHRVGCGLHEHAAARSADRVAVASVSRWEHRGPASPSRPRRGAAATRSRLRRSRHRHPELRLPSFGLRRGLDVVHAAGDAVPQARTAADDPLFQPQPRRAGTPVRAAWQHSRDSSTVWGRVTDMSFDANFVAPGAVAWLTLEKAGDQEGPAGGDQMTEITFIQRLNTVGGSAPTTGCGVATDIGKKGVRALPRRLLLLRGSHLGRRRGRSGRCPFPPCTCRLLTAAGAPDELRRDPDMNE